MMNLSNLRVTATPRGRATCLLTTLGLTTLAYGAVLAQTSHTNPHAAQDMLTVANRPDVRHLPAPLKNRLVELAGRPHTYLAQEAFNEANAASSLLAYSLIDTTGFEPNIFTSAIAGINDRALPTAANAANGGLPTIGALRIVAEPKAGVPVNANDPNTVIDIFTDLSGLFVINNESGWYEGWVIRSVHVPKIAPPRAQGRAQFGTITREDAAAIRAMGDHNNVPGHVFTADGKARRNPSVFDHFPDVQNNTVRFPVSLGSFNAMQQSDVHSYWEFNTDTNWVFPHFELPFTGGLPGAFEDGLVGSLGVALWTAPVIPGSGPSGISNDPVLFGDNPFNPRDPDRGLGVTPGDRAKLDPKQAETRNRFIPSGLTEELLLDVFLRVKSFEPGVGLPQRLFDAYAYEVSLVDANGDGVISFKEADIKGVSDGLSNSRLYLPFAAFEEYAMTREINDGMLAPRFAPSTRAYVLSGNIVLTKPVPASSGRDGDDR